MAEADRVTCELCGRAVAGDARLEVSRAEERVPAEQREAFRADVLASLRRYADGDAVRLPATVVLASGRS